jgi:pyrrolidone-carboxylate peptidase
LTKIEKERVRLLLFSFFSLGVKSIVDDQSLPSHSVIMKVHFCCSKFMYPTNFDMKRKNLLMSVGFLLFPSQIQVKIHRKKCRTMTASCYWHACLSCN